MGEEKVEVLNAIKKRYVLNSLNVRECQPFQSVGENILFYFFLLPNDVAILLKYSYPSCSVKYFTFVFVLFAKQ